MSKKGSKIDDLLRETVVTLNGSTTLKTLIETIGVKIKVKYFNWVEKGTGSTIKPFKVVKVTTGYGLVFKNELEIKNVEPKVWRSCTASIEERRQRK